MQTLSELIKSKNVIFITTKNLDYIRNTQEIGIIKDNAASIDIICSEKKNYLLRILHVWFRTLKKRISEDSIVFIGFEPQFVLPFIGFKFKKNYVIIDFFISVYDTLICDRKKFKDGGLVSKFSRWMDEKTIRKAKHIISDTKAHSQFFVSEFGGNPDDIETIYLKADESIYFPRPQNKPAELKDKFVVLYFGSILPLQGVDVVLDSVRELKDCPDIYFDIIGPIPDKYNKPIQDNVQYTEWLSQEKLAEHIANADLCLAGHFNPHIKKADRTIPGKAYIYENMKKRMILSDSQANKELFKEDSKHMFISFSEKNKMSTKLARVIKESRNRK